MRCKMKIFTILSFLINLFISSTSYSQENISSEDFVRLKSIMHPHSPKKVYLHAHNNFNEVQFLFSGLFLFYKSFISSQDSQSCSFTPSCSEFGMEAVKTQGLFIGVLNTIDRLTRCNSLSPEKYIRDPKTSLLLDPL
jgi:uncharacterized protein